MQLRDIAWSALKRRPARLAFMVVALALGIGTVVALSSFSAAMEAEVGDELDRFGANIVVTPRATSLEVAYGGVAIAGLNVDTRELTLDDARKVRTIHHRRNINAVAPKLVGSAAIEGKRLLLVGVQFREEARAKGWWTVDGAFGRTAADAMLGAHAARALGKRPGDVVQVGDQVLRLTGVAAENGALEDDAVLVDLGVAQQILNRPAAISLIEVGALCRGCPIEDIVSQIAGVLPHARVSPIRQAVAAREKAVQQFVQFAYGVSIVVLLVGGLVVFTTMMASVTERTAEIGILRAIGFRQAQVARVVLIEAIGVNVVGGLVGWIAGTVAVRWLGPSMAQLSDAPALDLRLAATAVVLAVVIGALGGGYPALRAARMDPATALRHL